MLREDTNLMVSQEPYSSEASFHQYSNSGLTDPLNLNSLQWKNNHNSSGGFSYSLTEEFISFNKFEEQRFQSFLPESVSQDILVPANLANFWNELNYIDPLTGQSFTDHDVVLEAAISQAREQLNVFAKDREFLIEINQTFGNNFSAQEASTLIQKLASGEALPNIEIIPSVELSNENGAFGGNKIYLSEKFLSQNTHNLKEVTGVLLEEIGHYIDRELNVFDTAGDEGNIFAQFVQNESITEAELAELKAEDDSTTIWINGSKLAVELSESPYQGMSADAAERRAQEELAAKAASYPGYALKYDPNNPEQYDEDPEVVRLWQQRMKDLGYEINVDGYYGEESAGIARQFQEDNGLEVDGFVGPITWETSFSPGTPTADSNSSSLPTTPDAAERRAQEELAAKAASYPGYALKYDPNNPKQYDEDPEVVRLWQQRMKDLGYEIDVDGYYGEESAGVARQFQKDNDLEIDGFVGPITWEASFSSDATEPSSTPSTSPDAEERRIQAERIDAYESLYIRELYKDSDLLERKPGFAETTWNMTAQEMLEDNKDFLKLAAQRYEIDGRAIAGAIRWEYEVNSSSRRLDFAAYDFVQTTGELPQIAGKGLNGNGWGKMHYDTAKKIIEESGEEVPTDRTLARLLAVPTSSIDLIARLMDQAAQAYEQESFDIRYNPAVLTTLYRIGEDGEDNQSFEERARNTRDNEETPTHETEGMGQWVFDNVEIGALEEYRTFPV